MQLALAIRKWRLVAPAASRRRCRPAAKIDARITRLFPFELTAGQRQAIDEIAADMARPFPMNRLLQGDVGSGKTVVAMYAMLLAVAHGYQAALMAPTEILARQHLANARHAPRPRAKCGWRCSPARSRPRERQEVLAKIAAGEVDVVIGTQAVTHAVAEIGRRVRQARAGGDRRAAQVRRAAAGGAEEGRRRSALPGDDRHADSADGRHDAVRRSGRFDAPRAAAGPADGAHAIWPADDQRMRWWHFFRKKLDEGRQGYVIAPLVEEAEAVEAANVQADLRGAGQRRAGRVIASGLLHGRMTPAEKDAAMQAFRAGRTQVLVATSVVEVGVDVPNATLMTIEGGERFGLAQLHQLRGRISRGSHPGYLLRLRRRRQPTKPQERLDAFTKTSDGFELAEIDFRPPRPRRSVRHAAARPAAAAHCRPGARRGGRRRSPPRRADLIASDPELANPAFARLRRMVFHRYGEALDLGDVG